MVECGLTFRVWLLHSDALPLEVHIAEDLPMVNRIHQNVVRKLEIPGPLLQAQVQGKEMKGLSRTEAFATNWIKSLWLSN